MMSPGRTLGIGFSVSNWDIQVVVIIMINRFTPGSAGSRYVVTKLHSGNSGFRVLSTQIELSAGD